MRNRLGPLGRIVGTVALAAFAWGLAYAVYFVATHKYVLEFQSGDASKLSERLVAVAQRAGLEGAGFAALALVLGSLGWAAAAIRAQLFFKTNADRGRVAWAGFLLAATAFGAWASFGTWLAGELLPFLSPKELLVLNLAGFGAIFIGLLAFDTVASRVSAVAAERPEAMAAGSSIACGGAAWLGVTLLQGTGGGWRDPVRLAPVFLGFVAALPIAAWIARGVARVLDRREARRGARPMLPRGISMTAFALLVVSAGVLACTAKFSAAGPVANYAKLASSGNSAGPNVILITIDTLRADHLGCYGYNRPTSPFLDSLAKEGVLFVDPVAPAAWTKPSTGTILTGLYPSRHGALYHGSELHTPEGCKTLAEGFRDGGYVTAGFVSNPNIKKVFKFDRGFQEFFDSPVEDTVTMSTFRNSLFGWVASAVTRYQFNWKNSNDVREINRNAFAWLERNHDSRFFLYLHYIDPHEPYDPPRAYAEQFARDHGFVMHNERKRQVGIDLYDGEIRYTDDNLAELWKLLERLGRASDTLVVVTSDHGEEFFEHGSLGHGYSLYQEVVRVPLIARGPGIERGKVVKHPVAIVDLAATLLDLAGVIRGVPSGDASTSAKFGDGKSFAASVRDPQWKTGGDFLLENEFGEDDTDLRSFVLSAIRTGPWKFVVNEVNAYRPPDNPKYGRFELYNLETDPNESHNLMRDPAKKGTVDEVWQGMNERLQEHGEFLVEKGNRDKPPAALSAEVEAELEAIGYLKGKKKKNK